MMWETLKEFVMPIYTTVVGLIIGLLVASLKDIVSKKKAHETAENDVLTALQEGMAILLRRQLFDYYGTYEYSENIPVSDWEEIEQTHKIYKKLGGNHSGDRIYEDLKSKHIGG